ncbi:MAG: hypothetical protein IK011_05180, partial [Bacteroidaceae bacterium]|nr:hypothetical protein [Bacteroidaceae bacterium]
EASSNANSSEVVFFISIDFWNSYIGFFGKDTKKLKRHKNETKKTAVPWNKFTAHWNNFTAHWDNFTAHWNNFIAHWNKIVAHWNKIVAHWNKIVEQTILSGTPITSLLFLRCPTWVFPWIMKTKNGFFEKIMRILFADSNFCLTFASAFERKPRSLNR